MFQNTKEKFYISTPIFYPNANLHMGHVYTSTISDIIARYNRLVGRDVYFLTGADENTEKVVRAAKSAGKGAKEYTDDVILNSKKLFEKLNISYDKFIRTSDEKDHWPGAQELWKRFVDAGDIETKSYRGLYCIGHESFITEKDLVNGKCPEHNELPQYLEEENYYFKLSKYTDLIKEKIKNDEFKIIPKSRKNEILALLDRGLDDVSFSRPSDKVSVGIPVPGDPTQKIYVWGDALASYITALGFGTKNDSLFKKFWPADVHVIGKDILRFHAAIWPAMLISAKLQVPKQLLVHGFITSGGRKMSKSLGNVIDPLAIVSEYGADALRYYLARHIHPFEDSDFTMEKFKEAYNANLANGLGNLVSRVMKMAEYNTNLRIDANDANKEEFPKEFADALDRYDIQSAANIVWGRISEMDEEIQKTEPFKLVKTDRKKAEEIIHRLVEDLSEVAFLLAPILPETSEKIKQAVKQNKMPEKPLFPRK